MARQYHQGKFTPRHPDKYIGDPTNIVFRSSWENRVMVYFDSSDHILKWASEEKPIMYISPVDNRPHRYFIDFFVMYKDPNGQIQKAAVEVKPFIQTQQPKRPKRITQTFIESVETYAVNQSKWEAAKLWCAEKGWQFILLTEHDIFPKKKSK